MLINWFEKLSRRTEVEMDFSSYFTKPNKDGAHGRESAFSEMVKKTKHVIKLNKRLYLKTGNVTKCESHCVGDHHRFLQNLKKTENLSL